ncbi:unnamed protein product [Cuscuta epithymum]|uniref:Uncharacterized protein n=1 Tax=Cuscuta epithymum TaxID=186058 RepID=A0AAV0EWQ9_9ASTE|nr:unnamed protein product [Cuscuta epithymum]
MPLPTSEIERLFPASPAVPAPPFSLRTTTAPANIPLLCVSLTSRTHDRPPSLSSVDSPSTRNEDRPPSLSSVRLQTLWELASPKPRVANMVRTSLSEMAERFDVRVVGVCEVLFKITESCRVTP